MRFRIPEVLLGCFLTVAVFALGMTVRDRPQTSQTAQSPSAEKPQTAAENKGEPKPFWEGVASDPIAAFTLGLVIVGLCQIGLFYFQLRYMRTGMEDATKAAKAAELSARAAVAIELPIIRTSPENFGYGRSDDLFTGRVHWVAMDSMLFANHGRSKAFPLEFHHGWAVGQLPDVPKYIFRKQFQIGEIWEPGKEYKWQIGWGEENPFEIDEGLADRIRAGQERLWFYCRLDYLDFMQTRHEVGFCWERYEVFGGGGFQSDATPAYNIKT